MAQGLGCDRQHNGQGVLHPVVQLREQQFLVLLDPAALGELDLRRAEKVRIVDGDRGLCGNSGHELLGPSSEHTRSLMAEEKATEHFARTGNDRDRKVTNDRQRSVRYVRLGISSVRRVLATAGRAALAWG